MGKKLRTKFISALHSSGNRASPDHGMYADPMRMPQGLFCKYWDLDFSSYGCGGRGHSVQQWQPFLLLWTEPYEDKATQARGQSPGACQEAELET